MEACSRMPRALGQLAPAWQLPDWKTQLHQVQWSRYPTASRNLPRGCVYYTNRRQLREPPPVTSVVTGRLFSRMRGACPMPGFFHFAYFCIFCRYPLLMALRRDYRQALCWHGNVSMANDWLAESHSGVISISSDIRSQTPYDPKKQR